jgi:transposase
LIDSHAISSQSLKIFYGVNAKNFQRHYKEKLSDYNQWDQKHHAEQYLIYPENIGSRLTLDETALSNGELYTILTNKAAKGKKGSIVGIFSGTNSEDIISLIKAHIPKRLRNKVSEISLDMAASMNLIAKSCFTKAHRVADRFHVQRLACDAVQEIRIKHRWDAIDQDHEAYQTAKYQGRDYQPKILPNGDTLKQLLARSRYLLFKHYNNWTDKQRARAEILFEMFPDIEKAYELSMSLNKIFEKKYSKQVGLLKLARWENKVQNSGFKSFKSIVRTFHVHYDSIANFFINRSTNAAAESFNAKIKDFRRQFRGVTDLKFFLYRLTKIYA